MRNLLSLIGLAVVVFFGLGWYLGWYKFTSTPTATGRRIEIDLNTPKITTDTKSFGQKVQGFFDGNTSPGSILPLPSVNTANPSPSGSPTFYIDSEGNMHFKPTNLLNPK